MMTCCDVPPTAAAFEWNQWTPQSLVLGDSSVRWPVACAGPGFCADALVARPFNWPGVTASGLSVVHDGRLSLGSGWSLLQAPAYRESRLAVGISRHGGRQRLGLVASFLYVGAGDAGGHVAGGAALDLGWDLRLSPLTLVARVSGVLESEGARHLSQPREWKLAVCMDMPSLVAEFKVEEGSRGRRAGWGLILRPWLPLALGVGWSTTEVPLRLFVEARRSRVAVSWGMAFHNELPPTPIIALSLLSSPVEGEKVRPDAHQAALHERHL